jgi:3-hydroxybutyryl-CoA dehydrogenase
MIKNICVAGAGTMGSGIALASAQNGYTVNLFDTNEQVLHNASKGINKNLDFLVEKNKITPEEKSRIIDRTSFSSKIKDCKADLIIEAIIEKEDAKVSLFEQLSAINADNCIFASNTSSLSITSLQKRIANPGRVAGMHFFNPAQIMKLVEVVKGAQTSDEVIQILIDVCNRLKKTPVLCIDAPGFIVNR